MSKELHILSNSDMFEFVLEICNSPNTATRTAHACFSHEKELNFVILLWETDHRRWVNEFTEGNYCFSVLHSDFFGYCCHSGLDPVGFRLIWVD